MNLTRLKVTLRLEAVSAFALLIFLGNFIFQHWSEPRFAWPAVFMDVWTVAIFATSIRQLVAIAAIRYDGPVLEVQKSIEAFRLLRFRVVRFALITGLVVWWLPMLVVVSKAFFGLDAYRIFGKRYFLVNALAAGLAAPLLFWLSTKFSQRMMNHATGRYVAEALTALTEISEFERPVY